MKNQRNLHPNLENLRIVANSPKELREKAVFVGGAIVNLLITDPASPEVRMSTDVDVVFEIVFPSGYEKLANRLRELGFREDMSKDYPLICQWTVQGVSVDIMPTDNRILGFSNEWYMEAINTAQWFDISGELNIRVISAPCFIMTKLAAFNNRGRKNFLDIRDMEDIVAILDGRPEIVQEVKTSNSMLRAAIMENFRILFQDEDFIDSIPGHSVDDSRPDFVINRILEIMDLK
ncbi:MAG: hypothetical protein AB7V04_05465 [Desulfomonilaceae bacterium]